MNTLLELISQSGIKTSEETEKGNIKAEPHYRGNCGFYHLIGDNWELTFIKGVYKSNISIVKGESPYSKKIMNNIAQGLADIERSLRKPVSISLYVDDNSYVVTSAEVYTPEKNRGDKRDPFIKSPLTPVEKSLGKGDRTNSKHLFIRAPFAEIAPETLSPAAMSIASVMPDVLNPLFMSCSIKTQSPSIKLLFGRLYMNLANAETILPAFKQTTDMFTLNFAPSVFKTIKKPSFGVPDDSDLNITDAEILDALKEVKEISATLKPEDIFEDNFAELTALCVMLWEMIYVRLWKSFAGVHKLIGRDISETLRHIYMTRSESILEQNFDSIATDIDPASAMTCINGIELNRLSTDEMFSKLSTAKRITLSKSKYAEKLKEAHRFLKLRDDAYITIMDLSGKLHEFLLRTGKDFTENSMLTAPEDIFFFEMSEIKSILGDEFFGNIPFTINFRKWQGERFAAMCMPYNLYEKDVERSDEIAAAQLKASEESSTLPCISFFHKDIQGDNYVVKKSWRLDDIKDASGKEAVLTESASIFSFIAEYCAVTETPLYTGARFAGLLLTGQNISTAKDCIAF